MSKYKSYTISLFIILQSILANGQSNSVEIWMRAFIPNPENAGEAVGNILPMPNGKPGSLVRMQQTFAEEHINQCFATDHRTFSSEQSTTSRLETKFTILLSPSGTGTVTPTSNRTTAAVTRKLECGTGEVIEQLSGSVTRDHLGTPSVADGIVQVIGQAQGLNMLAFGAQTTGGAVTPGIDYNFDLQWKPSTSTLTSAISYGSFPAFEMYARQPGGPWVNIVQHLPTSAPWRLMADGLGVNIIRNTKTIVIPSGLDGKWQTPAPDKRFMLEITGNKVKWTERNASGGTLTKEVQISDAGNGNFRIDRPNDNEVLTFLGFQPSLRNEILARGPQPSFIIFRKDGKNIRGEWNGLIATKDANAHLSELIQPGVRPPKVFMFDKFQ